MDLSQVIDNLQKIFTIIAIVIGGLWTYFNFFQGRIYRLRLEPKISGKITSDGEVCYLIVTAHLKNVGLSKVDIQQEGSALRVFSHKTATSLTEAVSADWEHLATFPVFEDHRWIESNETIEEQRLIVIPQYEHIAFRLALRVVSENISWKAMAIVNSPSQKDV